MLSLARIAKVSATIAVAAFLATSNAPRSYAGTGYVHVKVSKAGFIVGVGGGSGTLSFKGKTYRLKVGGIGIGTIGVSGAELTGTATNLNTAPDIAGTYTAVSSGVAVGGGPKATTLKNTKGVVLHLRGKQVGFEASLSLSGLTVSLQ